MRKSRWIEIVEWGVLAGIAFFMLGLFLTRGDPGADSEVPLTHIDE